MIPPNLFHAFFYQNEPEFFYIDLGSETETPILVDNWDQHSFLQFVDSMKKKNDKMTHFSNWYYDVKTHSLRVDTSVIYLTDPIIKKIEHIGEIYQRAMNLKTNKTMTNA